MGSRAAKIGDVLLLSKLARLGLPLGAAAFDSRWAEGRALSPEATTAYALEEAIAVGV